MYLNRKAILPKTTVQPQPTNVNSTSAMPNTILLLTHSTKAFSITFLQSITMNNTTTDLQHVLLTCTITLQTTTLTTCTYLQYDKFNATPAAETHPPPSDYLYYNPMHSRLRLRLASGRSSYNTFTKHAQRVYLRRVNTLRMRQQPTSSRTTALSLLHLFSLQPTTNSTTKT